MATLTLIIVQVLGAISLYFWFFANSQFFYLINKHRNGNPFLLFIVPLGFFSFPAILALAYKLSWDFFEEKNYLQAFGLTSIPIILFFLGVIILKKIRNLD